VKYGVNHLFSIFVVANSAQRNTVHDMKRKIRMRPASFRLCEDQLEKLDILVTLARGRKDRSVLIREALDSYIESKIPSQQLDFIAQP
jgi:hypothetical protein